jgi:hypothetical protein
MRALHALALTSLCLGACTDPDDPGDEPAWTDGPAGHVYVYAGPLYDLDAHDGRILRRIVLDHAAASLRATSDHAYFTKFDTAGTGRVFQLGLDSDVPTQLGEVSNLLLGTAGDQLVGVRNASEIVRTNLTTGEVTNTVIPGGLSCESGSIAAGTLYLACVRFGSPSEAGMIALDLAANSFGAFIVVKSAVQPISAASNVSATPAGVVFVLYEGTASLGTRTAYAIDVAAGTAGPAIPLPGRSDDLDEQDAIGGTLYLTLFPDNQILPFEVATRTALPPITVDQPRHLRAGGDMLWVASRGLDGALARVEPVTGAVTPRTFPPLEASGIDSLAFGGE